MLPCVARCKILVRLTVLLDIVVGLGFPSVLWQLNVENLLFILPTLLAGLLLEIMAYTLNKLIRQSEVRNTSRSENKKT